MGNGSTNGTFTFSDLEAASVVVGQGNLNDNPLFVDSSNANFHLQAGSPAINSGTSVSGVTTDLEGIIARPSGAGFDMGAFEFNDGPPPVNAVRSGRWELFN